MKLTIFNLLVFIICIVGWMYFHSSVRVVFAFFTGWFGMSLAMCVTELANKPVDN